MCVYFQAVDKLSFCCINCDICLHVLLLLLLFQDKVSDSFLEYQFAKEVYWGIQGKIPTINSYFFFFRMYGLFQTSFYFGYMAVFSTALGIMCGKFRIYWNFSVRIFQTVMFSHFSSVFLMQECVWILRKSMYVLWSEFQLLYKVERLSVRQEYKQKGIGYF